MNNIKSRRKILTRPRSSSGGEGGVEGEKEGRRETAKEQWQSRVNNGQRYPYPVVYSGCLVLGFKCNNYAKKETIQ